MFSLPGYLRSYHAARQMHRPQGGKNAAICGTFLLCSPAEDVRVEVKGVKCPLPAKEPSSSSTERCVYVGGRRREERRRRVPLEVRVRDDARKSIEKAPRRTRSDAHNDEAREQGRVLTAGNLEVVDRDPVGAGVYEGGRRPLRFSVLVVAQMLAEGFVGTLPFLSHSCELVEPQSTIAAAANAWSAVCCAPAT